MESDGLTAASVPCAAEEQMAHGEMLAKWAESSNALQNRRNMSCSEEESEGLGRCLDLFLKKKLEERDLRLLLVRAASKEKDLALPCCKRGMTATEEVKAASGSEPWGALLAQPHTTFGNGQYL